MQNPSATPALSVLELAPICVGNSLEQALRDTRRLAQGVEQLGYHRFWLAEHHNAAAFASAATTVLMGYVLAATSRIRVGAGGIMLPNHAPLMVAEQFGTLAALYPGRLDLGVGRSAGTDPAAASLLRRGASSDSVPFSSMLNQLLQFFQAATPDQAVRAVPGEGLALPIWILGGSPAAAEFAATRGLPFAYAGHFRMGEIAKSFATYRQSFRASSLCPQPLSMVCINVIAAASDEEARYLARSREQRLLDMLRGKPRPLQAPDKVTLQVQDAAEQAQLEAALGFTIQGGPNCIAHQFSALTALCAPDEIIINTEIHDFAARLRSYQIVAQALQA